MSARTCWPSRARRPGRLVPQRGSWLVSVGSIVLTAACSGEVADPAFDGAAASGFLPGSAQPGVDGVASGAGTPGGVTDTGVPGGTTTAGPGMTPAVTGPGDVVNPPGVEGGGGGVGNEPGTAGTGGDPIPVDCTQPSASAARLRILTESQFNHTVLDLLGVSGNFGDGLGRGTDDVSLELRMNAVEQVAAAAVANLSEWAPCTPDAAEGAAACQAQIIDEIGALGFRRALSELEREQFRTLFEAGVAARDFETGVEWFLNGLLQAPDFVYEVVRPAATETPGAVVTLAPQEYATRLAYFIWDGPPDEALTSAAASGGLSDAAQRDAQIARMLDDPKFLRGVSHFYSRWLPVSGFAELARDAEGFDGEVAEALKTSLMMSVTDLYSSADANIGDLLSGETYFLNDTLRDFYGIAPSGAHFTPTQMVGESRYGILTHPALMAVLARPRESNPISRGLYLLRSLLCVDVPPPPDGVDIPDLPPVAEGVSTRERLLMHTEDPLCAACHDFIDPAGFVFEAYDEVGRFRTTDHSRAVDTSGTLTLNRDTDGAFTQGAEFLQKLSNSQSVRECFAEHYLDFALSHDRPDPADACSLQSISDSFAGSGNLQQLVVSVATSDSFRMRLAEGIGQ